MQPIAPAIPAAPRAGIPAAPPAAPPAEASPAAAGPNPRLRIDPALNLLVVEFRGQDGSIIRTAPTEQELRDYRAAQRRGECLQASSVMPLARAADCQGAVPEAEASSALFAK